MRQSKYVVPLALSLDWPLGRGADHSWKNGDVVTFGSGHVARLNTEQANEKDGVFGFR